MLEAPLTAILLPLAAGVALLLAPRRWSFLPEAVSFVVSLAVLVLACIYFIKIPDPWSLGGYDIFRIDKLSAFIALFIGLFGVAVTLYSIGFMKTRPNLNQYYANILWTIGGSIGAAFSNNLIVLLSFWGFLGLTLYLLISMGGAESASAAKKAFIIVGGSDAAMLLGIAIIWHLTGTFEMSAVKINLGKEALAYAAFICLAIGAFAKAGAMPLHTWIPDSSEVAPTPVMAFLPASLDKLLGIYLLVRLTLGMFVITPNSPMSVLLLVVGAVTIIAAVMMALIQHDFKRLLAYCAVSQVGYMVLGIGTATPLGIAGGLFHMANHAIYKSCLFLSGGSVEKSAGTSELDKLGGLAWTMPITFTTCLIASLSISGVPPFNGFFSKWMIYQSLVDMGKSGNKTWIIWLVTAMFGSALTLASFMKLLYSVFLSPRTHKHTNKEVPFSMWLPQVVLAALCVVFGIFAFQIPIRLFIAPSIKECPALSYPGVWNSAAASLLLLTGLFAGLLFFFVSRAMPVRRSGIFIGGETLEDNSGVKAGSFYNTIKDIPLLGALYKTAQDKVFDIYEQGSRATFFLADILRWLHNGILPTYMAWCLVGMLILFLMLVR